MEPSGSSNQSAIQETTVIGEDPDPAPYPCYGQLAIA